MFVFTLPSTPTLPSSWLVRKISKICTKGPRNLLKPVSQTHTAPLLHKNNNSNNSSTITSTNPSFPRPIPIVRELRCPPTTQVVADQAARADLLHRLKHLKNNSLNNSKPALSTTLLRHPPPVATPPCRFQVLQRSHSNWDCTIYTSLSIKPAAKGRATTPERTSRLLRSSCLLAYKRTTTLRAPSTNGHIHSPFTVASSTMKIMKSWNTLQHAITTRTWDKGVS
ncbi:hypothetical protein BDV96DRAFT_168125 [Lophiotrema nucula]|uniref:Uncharacterized protein n=1 Tax=Lophiotrema nucula TaxID=690887 RepID=A0A6A5YY19_9PLEO|nr:hypothetical protein BDV96DRAFT_168125 [Lophiotrema nucula]